MNKELKLLLLSLFLIICGIVYMFIQQRGCHQVAYQSLDGKGFEWICDGGKNG